MTTPDVNQIIPGSNGNGEGEPTIPPVVPPVATPPKPGEKTDPALLLKSLQEERDKRRQAEDEKAKAEAELQGLKTALASGNPLSEEGMELQSQITTLEATISTLLESKVMGDLQAKFPILKEKASEFAEFKKNYPAGNDEAVVKIFLAENNLLEVQTPRRGLETPSGGGRTTTPEGWTFAKMDELRKTNYRQYTKLLKDGAFKEVGQ